MLTGRKLAKRYGARLVFRDLDFEVAPGRVAAVLGSNGAGKSTLLRIVAGLMRPSQGEVSWHPAHNTALQWSCALAAPDAPVYRELTVAENIEFFAAPRTPMTSEAIGAHLEKFGLAARANDAARDLSSGLRARLQLAIATLHAPRVLLLDEPSANLDEAGRDILRGTLKAQRAHGLALVATNDTRDLELCDTRIEL
jgi:heme exporter protein A